MNSLQKKIASTIAAGALLVNMALPVLAGTTIVISGNGSETDNDAEVVVTTTTTVVQSNTADINNDDDAEAETGDNSADDNTSGAVAIETGDAEVAVGVSNTVNSNSADIDGCCETGADVLISENGSGSDNTVKLGLDNTTAVFQDNMADIKNDVDAEAETGENSADDNTGGEVTIESGDAEVLVLVENAANSNSARVGGTSDDSSVSARILGNGSETDNDIVLGLSRSLMVTQDNLAKIRNDVDAEAETGENSADDNTGGAVGIETGDAEIGVGIDNMANFNTADVDCGCILDVLAKIAGNGSPSDNDIKASLVDTRAVFQDNDWSCDGHSHGLDFVFGFGGGHHGRDCNDVDAEADTGDNDIDDSTGDPGTDPLIETGDAEVDVLIENAGNANSVGASDSGMDLNFPEGFSFNLNLSFSLSDLLSALGLV